MPARFVILFHETPPEAPRPDHFDLMFERQGTLATWAVKGLLDDDRLAIKLPDHRVDYLDYEGPVSGDRGQVSQHDKGTCDILQFDNDAVTIEVRGQRWRGRFQFTHIAESEWTFHFTTDT